MTMPPEVRVTAVTVEHLRRPLGVGTPRPRLSWRVSTAAPGWTQAAHEVALGEATGRHWTSTGRAESADSQPFATR